MTAPDAVEARLRRDLPALADALLTRDRGTGAPAPPQPPPPATLGGTVEVALNSPAPRPRRLLVTAAAMLVVLLGVGAVAVLAWPRPTTTTVAAPSSFGTWRPITRAPIEPRAFPVTAWTGSELVVWAGSNLSRGFAFTDGATYDPATDSWRSLATPGWGHPGLTSTFLDGELYTLAKGGGTRFDPVEGTWTDLPEVEGMFLAATVATGDAVWGLGPATSNLEGQTDVAVRRYDRAADAWVEGPTFTGTPETGSLFQDVFEASTPVLWTGSEIVVWNADGPSPAFDPATGTWEVLPQPVPPAGGLVSSTATVTDLGLTVLADVVDGSTGSVLMATRSSDPGGGWTWHGGPLPVGDLHDVTIASAGEWLLLFAAGEQPVVVHVPSGTWERQDAALIGPVGGPGTAWTGGELLVWGGLTETTEGGAATAQPASDGAVWIPPTG